MSLPALAPMHSGACSPDLFRATAIPSSPVNTCLGSSLAWIPASTHQSFQSVFKIYIRSFSLLLNMSRRLSCLQDGAQSSREARRAAPAPRMAAFHLHTPPPRGHPEHGLAFCIRLPGSGPPAPWLIVAREDTRARWVYHTVSSVNLKQKPEEE